MERLFFMTICSSNLDEFFEIRVSGVKQQMAMGVTESGIDATTPEDVMRRISAETHEIVAQQYRVLMRNFSRSRGGRYPTCSTR